LGPLSTHVKQLVPPGAEEEMRGEGRQAVYDPVRGLLFTLYTNQPDEGHVAVHAFVHTLNVRDGWAFCVDLPAPFGTGTGQAHAIARSASGTVLVVVDAGSGTLAVVDPDQLTVRSVNQFAPPEPVADPAAACFSADGTRLFVAAGRTVTVVDPA